MSIKEKLYNEVYKIIIEKIRFVEESITLAKESRNNDTKSSAGDKYETGREMMQAEISKSEIQLQNLLYQKAELLKIKFPKKHNKVELGSLVITDKGNYFISTAIGKLTIENNDYYIISLLSPIGKLFFKKEINNIIRYQKREYLIKNIV